MMQIARFMKSSDIAIFNPLQSPDAGNLIFLTVFSKGRCNPLRDLDHESRVQLDSKTAESASNCVQNRAFYRSISGVETSKANCINRVYGAGDGNRTHVRSLGS
jgi:hypothetical protein